MSVVKPCGKVDMERFEIVKRVVETMQPGVTVTYDRGFWFHWTSRYSQKSYRHKWIPQKGNQYPANHVFPWGGTMCLLITQMIRWAKHMPVVPLSVIDHWFGPKVQLGDTQAFELICFAGWPESVNCVMCGRPLTDRRDWYDWSGIGVNCSGLGCHSSVGCQGKPPVKNNKRKNP